MMMSDPLPSCDAPVPSQAGAIRERTAGDEGWIARLLAERWGSPLMVVRGEAVDLLCLPALVAEGGQGLATYRVRDGEVELMSLDAVCPGVGIGTRSVEALATRLHRRDVSRLWVTTTNDNLSALRFYLRRGFELRCLRPGAVAQARAIKPSIPHVGENGISIRDELDLCRELT